MTIALVHRIHAYRISVIVDLLVNALEGQTNVKQDYADAVNITNAWSQKYVCMENAKVWICLPSKDLKVQAVIL